ncbi:MAG: phosphoglucosamine mutase [Phycisphaerales bacterium]|nr:MAG: phosphoglucosamine mutase [Phycisphaerales bacterium]
MPDTRSDAPLMLGVSGLRGIVGRSLTPENAARYAGAFGNWLRERTGEVAPRVALGRDGRDGGEAIELAAIAGLLGAGCDVVRLGIAPTPTVGLAADSLDAGMVITASHNPGEWNGLKCLVTDTLDRGDAVQPFARAPFQHEADEIIRLYHDGPTFETAPETGRLTDDDDAPGAHVALVMDLLDDLLPADRQAAFAATGELGYLAVVDAVDSSGSVISLPFLATLGRVVPLHCLMTGVFPHTPEPTLENLSAPGGLTEAVPGLRADIGFAQDPDADRLAIIDERGRYIGEEYTLALAACSLLESYGKDAEGAVLVANLSTSRMIDDVAARYGARVERTPVGEANVVERMRTLIEDGQRVVLGGEGNGGVIWPDVCFVRDSLGSMALVLALMARTGKPVSGLVEMINEMAGGGGGNRSGYAIEKRKVEIRAKSDAEPAADAIRTWGERAPAQAGVRIDTQDGVRIDWGDAPHGGGTAWLHVRASNTEPIMRLIAEARTPEQARAILDEAARVIV